MTDCLSPISAPSIVEIADCAIQVTFGNIILASVVLLIIYAYLMWMYRLPLEYALPFGTVFIANLTMPYSELQWLFWLGYIVTFAILVLGIIRQLRS